MKTPPYRELQDTRLADVWAMTPADWQALRREMRQAQRLPKLNEHFRKHGADFVDLGVMIPDQYQQLFLTHVQRSDLEVFTYITTQKGRPYRYWVLAGMDNRVTALYNESRRRYWTLMRPDDFAGYLQSGCGWWLKVENLSSKPKVRRW